jgi:hypothetical protein
MRFIDEVVQIESIKNAVNSLIVMAIIGLVAIGAWIVYGLYKIISWLV